MSDLCMSGMDKAEGAVTKLTIATSMELKHDAGENKLATVLRLTCLCSKAFWCHSLHSLIDFFGSLFKYRYVSSGRVICVPEV